MFSTERSNWRNCCDELTREGVLEEKEKAARKEEIRKGLSVTSMMHRFIMGGFDEMEDFKEFMNRP